MGLNHISNTFTDIFGNVTTSYKANAGDKIVLTTVVEANILIQEDTTNSFQVDWVNNSLELLGKKSWVKEGFRIGDTVSLKRYEKSTWTLATTSTFVIDAVNDTIVRFTTAFGGYFDENNYILQLSTTRNFDELDFNVNHIDQSSNPVYNSLIDGEITNVKFNGLNALSVSGTKTGALVGNKSGQYLISSVLTRNADAHSSRVYTIVTTFIQSGIYDKAWFDIGTCLKLCFKYSFYSVAGDVSNLATLEFSENANTGWFNEAYNVDVVDATLTTGINQLDYSNAEAHTIVVNSASSSLYLGACFISSNDSYYKNKYNSQNDLTLLLNAYVPLAVGTYTSNGGLYTIEVTSITTVGTIRTIGIIFTPLAGFATLIESFDVGDRLFYIWVKAGNVNLLASSGQLYKNFASVQSLSIIDYFLKHNNNTESGLFLDLNKSNIEDNLAYKGAISFTPFDTFNNLKCSIISYNSVTFEEIELESIVFDISNAPINSSGQYILNEYQSVGNDLPTTSAKKTAHLTSNLTTNKWEIYYPFLNNWKYWEKQVNAPNDFYPNQNKNWLNYITGDWSLNVRISRSTDNIEYVRRKSLPVSDYNTEPLIDTTIELYRSNNTLVTAIIDNEIMTIKAVHEHLTVASFDFWGEITIEETETSPRYLLSTEIDYDYNTNSPIIPITGFRLTSETVGNITTFSCLLDASKCPENVKITSKIYLVEEYNWVQFENGDLIQFEDGTYAEWDE